MTPLVSIIIPAFNSEKFIDVAIYSLLNQKFKDFEVVVINDGSTDQTEKVIKNIARSDSRVRLVTQKNSGVSVARNNGILHSNGKYICFLDSDDYYSEDFLEKMTEEILRGNSDVCYCGYFRFIKDNKKRVYTKFQSKKLLENYILGKVRVQTAGWMIKKSVIINNNIQFTVNSAWGEDFEFFCKILSLNLRFTYVEKYLVFYNVENNEQSLSAFSFKKIDEDFALIERICNAPSIKENKSLKKILINYRLTSLITYRLLNALKFNKEKELILNYFEKYQSYLGEMSFKNGFRSLKLNISQIILIKKIKKL